MLANNQNASSRFFSLFLCTLLWGSASFGVLAQDRAIHQTLQFARGTSQAELHKRIGRGTSHVYHFRARKGQHLAASLKTGPHTSFTLSSLKSGRIEEADGVTAWDGTLPDTGEYLIEIGTDRTADYILAVSLQNL